MRHAKKRHTTSKLGWYIGLIVAVTILVCGVCYAMSHRDSVDTIPEVNSYQACLNSEGSIIELSDPGACVTVSGKRFPEPR